MSQGDPPKFKGGKVAFGDNSYGVIQQGKFVVATLNDLSPRQSRAGFWLLEKGSV